MPDWLTDFEWSWSTGLKGALIVLISVAVSHVVVFALILVLPADYFVASRHPVYRHPVLRWIYLIGKNLLGAGVVLLGIALSLPGVPGPGFVVILIGVSMLNFPGKRKLERKLVSRPGVLRTLNRIRAYFGRPQLVLDETVRPSIEPNNPPPV